MKEIFCGACGKLIKPGVFSIRCRLCMENYHADCWEKTAGCITPGCTSRTTQSDEQKKYSYKKCSFCNERIVDFAVRCRYCNSVLDPMLIESSSTKPDLQGSGFRKDPILTGLLNLVFPGAGYMYLGSFLKGIFWFMVAVAAWLAARGFGLIAVYCWVIFDSVRQAVQLNRNQSVENRTMQRL